MTFQTKITALMHSIIATKGGEAHFFIITCLCRLHLQCNHTGNKCVISLVFKTWNTSFWIWWCNNKRLANFFCHFSHKSSWYFSRTNKDMTTVNMQYVLMGPNSPLANPKGVAKAWEYQGGEAHFFIITCLCRLHLQCNHTGNKCVISLVFKTWNTSFWIWWCNNKRLANFFCHFSHKSSWYFSRTNKDMTTVNMQYVLMGPNSPLANPKGVAKAYPYSIEK